MRFCAIIFAQGLVVSTLVSAHADQLSGKQLAPGAAAENLGYTPLASSNNLSDLGNAATARANLGLATGTSGGAIPLLNTSNSWSGAQTFIGAGIAVAGAGQTMLATNSGTVPTTIVGATNFSTIAAVIENNAATSLYNSNGVGAFGRNYAVQVGGQNNLDGLYANVTSEVAGSSSWALNGVCNISLSTSSYIACVGQEIDIDNAASGGIGNAYEATGASTVSGSFSAFAVQWMDQQNYPNATNSVKWYAGLYEQDGSVLYGAQFAASQLSGNNISGAAVLYDYFNGSGAAASYSEFASSIGMQHQCNDTTVTCEWDYAGFVQLYAGSGAFDTYLSNSGHAAYFGAGANISSLTIGNGTAPVTVSGNLIASEITANTLVNFNYSPSAACTATGSITVQINGSTHALPYC